MNAHEKALNRLAKATASGRTVNLLAGNAYVKILAFNPNRVGLLIFPPNANGIALYWGTQDSNIGATLVGSIMSNSSYLDINIVNHGDLPTRELYIAAVTGNGNITIVELMAPPEAD